MNSAIDFKACAVAKLLRLRCATCGSDPGALRQATAIAQLLATLKLPLHTLATGKGGKGQADPPEQGVPLMRSLLMLGADTEVSNQSPDFVRGGCLLSDKVVDCRWRQRKLMTLPTQDRWCCAWCFCAC